jgi:hypothetical protein
MKIKGRHYKNQKAKGKLQKAKIKRQTFVALCC